MDDKRNALIIAADTYGDPKLKQLRSPAVDALALQRVLKDTDIGGFTVELSLNETEHIVRRKLDAFFKDRRFDDLLLLHFACHGIKDDDGNLYFATTDTELGRLDSTAISADFVNRQMGRSRSRKIVLLLDCCYSGAFAVGAVPRAGPGVDIKERFETGRGRAILTASNSIEYAWEGDKVSVEEVSPSFFTSALVRGLETGEADRDQDGLISLDELYDYVYDDVRERNPRQTPGKWVFGIEGDLYIARPPPLAVRKAHLLSLPRDYSKLRPHLELGTTDEVFSIAFSSSGRTLAAGSDGVVHVWNSDTEIGLWKRPPEPTLLDKIHRSYVYTVVFSPDGRKLASGGEDGIVQVTDLESGLLWSRGRHEEGVYSVAFSPDGRVIASGGYDRKVILWDAMRGTVRRQLTRPRRVSSVAFSPDPGAKLLAVGSLDNTVTLWNFETGEIAILPDGHVSSVERVAFSPDGTFLASCGLDKAVRLWDVRGVGKQIWWNNVEHEYLVRAVAFAPDGATLASAGWDKTVKLWNTKTGEPIELPWEEDWPHHTDWIWSVDFSFDGTILGSGGSDGKIILWSLSEQGSVPARPGI